MITLIDYGLGNIQAFANIYQQLNIPFKFAQTPSELSDSSHLILPGVGSFDWAMKCLETSGMRPELDRLVLKEKLPILGVCVGMQIMAMSSDEGKLPGLGWFDTHINYFNEKKNKAVVNLPHMGWNDVRPKGVSKLFLGLENLARFYFLHSYYILPNKKCKTLATSNYGVDFTCAVEHENILGVQFHPEKSHEWGVQLLKNFSTI